MKFFSCAFAVIWIATATGVVAATLHQESFESAPGSGYSLSSQFATGFDYFGRFPVPDLSNAARDDFVTGWDGTYGIMGQDHDGIGGAASQFVTLSDIDISGFQDLSIGLSLGALNSEPLFLNYESDDGIWLRAAIDGGPMSLLAAFLAPSDGGDLRLDTDNDGIGDGARLTTELSDFFFDLSGTGSTLNIEVEFSSNASFEPVAMDNVRVTGTEVSVVPLPAALPLLLASLGALAIAGRRRAAARS